MSMSETDCRKYGDELTPIKEQEILKQLTQKLEVDTAEIEHDLSIIMIVGEKMKSQVGVFCIHRIPG